MEDIEYTKYKSIKELVQSTKLAIELSELDKLVLTCEVGNIKQWKTMYFITLKDTSGAIDAHLYAQNYTEPLYSGDKITLAGTLSLYCNPTRTTIHIKIHSYVVTGKGNLHEEFNKKLNYCIQQGYTTTADITKPYFQQICISYYSCGYI